MNLPSDFVAGGPVRFMHRGDGDAEIYCNLNPAIGIAAKRHKRRKNKRDLQGSAACFWFTWRGKLSQNVTIGKSSMFLAFCAFLRHVNCGFQVYHEGIKPAGGCPRKFSDARTGSTNLESADRAVTTGHDPEMITLATTSASYEPEAKPLDANQCVLHLMRRRRARKTAGYPERFAQEALWHNSKAGHRAYAKSALMKIPSLEDFEQRVFAASYKYTNA